MPPAIIGGTIAAVGSLAGGAMALFGGGGNEATQAAQIQAQSARYAADLQMQMYREAVAREQPWVTAGTAAVGQIAGLEGLPGYTPVDPTATLKATPGYNWLLGQGVTARDLSAASRGLALSGAQQRGLTDFGQNLAQTYAWTPYMNTLQNLSQWGQAGAALQGAQGMQAGQQVGQDIMAGGQAQGQGIYNQYLLDQANRNNWLNLMGGGLGMGMSRTPQGGTYFGDLYKGLSNYWGGGGGGYGGTPSQVPGYGPMGYGSEAWGYQ